MSLLNPLNWFSPSGTPQRKRKRAPSTSTPSKLPRTSYTINPRYSREEYEQADLYGEGPREAAERRMSHARFSGNAATVVSGSDDDEDDGGTDFKPRYKAPIKVSTLASSKRLGRPASRDRLAEAIRNSRKIAGEAGLGSDSAQHLEDLKRRVGPNLKVPEPKTRDSSSPFPWLIPDQDDLGTNQSPVPKPVSDAEPASMFPSERDQHQWATDPNVQARKLLNEYGPQRAAHGIQTSISEPQYALRDIEIRDRMWQLMNRMERFAQEHFSFDIITNRVTLSQAFNTMQPETVNIIAYVASGGPGGREGWFDLFFDEQKRRALVCAILGNVLVEQVFQHMSFGSDIEGIKRMFGIQIVQQNLDGFDRNRSYAQVLDSTSSDKSHTRLNLPLYFQDHVFQVVAGLLTHLNPILSLCPDPQNEPRLLSQLYELVATSGILSLLMRHDPHTVYYFTPAFKEDTFDPEHHESFNKVDMRETDPRGAGAAALAQLPEQERKIRETDSELIQITIMSGVTAYRRGGWEKPESSVWEPKFRRDKKHKNKNAGGGKGDEEGIRCRPLTQAWVYCRWGQAGGRDIFPKHHGKQWKGGPRGGFLGFGQFVKQQRRIAVLESE